MKRRIMPIAAGLILIAITAILADNPNRTDSTGVLEGRHTMRTYTDKWAILPEWTASPTIDGRLNEALWEQAARLDGFTTAFYERPTSHEIGYKAAYGAGRLYIAGRMEEDEAGTLAFVEIVLQAAGDNSTLHHVLRIPFPASGPNDPVIATYWNTTELNDNSSRRELTESVSGIASADGFVTLEASIPLAALAPDGVEPGEEWGVNILHVHRLYEAPLLSWVPVRHADFIHRPSPAELASGRNPAAYSASVVNEGRLGSVFFRRLPQRLLPAPSVSPVPTTVWRPAEAELRYAGFTEKVLSFSVPEADPKSTAIRLWWQEPGGAWEPVAAAEAVETRGRFTVSFQHPAPNEAGMYRLQLIMRREEGDTLAAMLTFDQNRMAEAGLAAIAAAVPSPEAAKRPVPWTLPSARVESLLALIPEQPGFRFTGLPEMPELSPDGLYKLSPDGQSLIASRTGTVYPNGKYAETG
ncbi:MAG: Carbohydrate family 9 binding domain-like, partial [Paenibacillus sp.]|nr:Carbohydrate family 9 binding domain-like [Paenibacillus sp.]